MKNSFLAVRFGGSVATSSEWRWDKRFVRLNAVLQFFFLRVSWGWWVGDAPGIDPVKYVIQGPILPFTGWYTPWTSWAGDARSPFGGLPRPLVTWGWTSEVTP